LVKTFRMCASLLLPVRGVILNLAFFGGSVHPSLRIRVGAGLHLFLDSLF
jgi:hypothetical protein